VSVSIAIEDVAGGHFFASFWRLALRKGISNIRNQQAPIPRHRGSVKMNNSVGAAALFACNFSGIFGIISRR
jgi:hypothetical protein